MTQHLHFVISAMSLVVMARAETLHLTIHTEGVFQSSGNAASNSSLAFLPTSSFEDLSSLSHGATKAAYNLGAISGGTPSGNTDEFTLSLRQSVNGSPEIVVGTWSAWLRKGVLQFRPEGLRFSDGERQYVWILDQSRYDVARGGFIPINATLFILEEVFTSSVWPSSLRIRPAAGDEERRRELMRVGEYRREHWTRSVGGWDVFLK